MLQASTPYVYVTPLLPVLAGRESLPVEAELSVAAVGPVRRHA
jgi:hypothetical protein